MSLIWCETDLGALKNNFNLFKSKVSKNSLIAPVVKSNAYGHGLVISAKAFSSFGADYLCVNSIEEARILKKEGIKTPIYSLGYIEANDLEEAVAMDISMVVYQEETIKRLSHISKRLSIAPKIHIKIETGNNRQGLSLDKALELAYFAKEEGLYIEGLATHFANVEDTTDHSFANLQLNKFLYAIDSFKKSGFNIPISHIANSAATLLWSNSRNHAHLNMVRPGISSYGLWPSRETFISTILEDQKPAILYPALTWKTKIAQIKDVSVGEYIGYGCTYMTTHKTKLAILPVGYADGYDRAISNLGYVLIKGMRAPVRGRVCMNIIMVDITDINGVNLEEEVVLLGKQNSEVISAELMADWIGTINYEVVSRIPSHIERIAV